MDVTYQPTYIGQTFFQSPTLSNLATALSLAQAEMPMALKESTNPFFKSSYADLASCWNTAKPYLAKNNLAIIQIPTADNTKVSVTTILTHKTGEYISGTLTMVARENTPQAIGSCITYARRYALQSFIGLAAEDDDGHKASNKDTMIPQQYSGGSNGLQKAKEKTQEVKNLEAAEKMPEALSSALSKPKGFDPHNSAHKKNITKMLTERSVDKEFWPAIMAKISGRPSSDLDIVIDELNMAISST